MAPAAAAGRASGEYCGLGRSILVLVCVSAVLVSGASAAPNPYCVAGSDWRPGGRMEALGLPGGLTGWDGCLAYRWGQFDPYNIPCMTNPEYRWSAFGWTPPFHSYYVDTDSIKDPQATADWVLAHPGRVYIIGNEPNNPDLTAGDGMTPAEYARMYHKYYTFIKDLDPTARIAVAGLVATSSTDSFNASVSYWNDVLNEYHVQFGTDMPVDIWNNHCYSFTGSLDPDRIIDTYFVPFRNYVNTVAGGIYADCPIWCTEFGIGMWSTALSPEYVAEFIEQLCPRLEASGALDRWFWFIGYWVTGFFRDSSLLYADNTPTPPGDAYSRLANSYPNPVPPPPPDPPDPPEIVYSDFSSGESPWRPIAGDWQVSDGAYRHLIGPMRWGQMSALPYRYDDLRMECDVKINSAEDDSGWAALNLRHGTIWAGGVHGYLVFLRRNGELGLSTQPDGTVASVPDAVADTSVYHRLAVTLVGTHIEVSLDGNVLITWDDPNDRYESGLVSVEGWKADCSFDDITVTACRARTEPGHYKPGWNLTSVPVSPFDPEATSVFDDLWHLGNTITFNLYAYDPAGGYLVYPQQFADVELGRGYWLYLSVAPPDAVVGVSGVPAGQEVSIGLEEGWNMLGDPFTAPVALADCLVHGGVVARPMAEAVADGLIAMPAYFYGEDGYRTVRLAGGDDDAFRPWYGYWVLSEQPGLSLVVPRP